MARCDARFDIGWAGRQSQCRLCDVVRRIGEHAFFERRDFRLGRRGAHQHAVAARAVHFLDHQLRHVADDVIQFVWLAAHEGRDVGDQGLFAEIKADHVRHVRVDGLVVRDAGADCVADRHVTRAIGAKQAFRTKRGVLAESLGIKEVVIHTAVYDIDASRALCRAHEHDVVFYKQVHAFDEFDTHLLGEKGMLEVGRVVHAGCEHNDIGLTHIRGGGCGVAQRVEQQVRVVRDRRDPMAGE